MTSYVVAATLASVFGVIILVFFSLCVYMLLFFTVTLESKRGVDLEAQINASVESIHSQRDFPNSNVTREGDIIVSTGVHMPQDKLSSPSLNEYQDAKGFLNSFADTASSHLKPIDRTPEEFIDLEINNPTIITTQLVSPENQSDIVKFDSFSKTLMIQNWISKALKKENQGNFIRRVEDNYSGNFIEIGEIVVVVKPFFGIEGYEFSCLQPGDLLRIVKFYVRTEPVREFSSKSIQLAPDSDDFFMSFEANLDIKHPTSANEVDLSTSSQIDGIDVISKDSATFMKSDEESYSKLYCTGIILNTYLEFDNEKNSLRLKFKTPTRFAQSESELLKDFPLNIVSLETTILNNIT